MTAPAPARAPAAGDGTRTLPGTAARTGTGEAVVPPRGWGRREVVAVAGFAVVLAGALARHEPWRDELQAWMLVRAAEGIGDLPALLRYEGHPWLWYALLWPVGRAVADPVGLQAVAWAVAVATAAVVLRWAPFSFGHRVMLLGSYLVLVEYATVARSYGLGLLLLAGACAAASSTPRRWMLAGALLALLALTSAFGAVLALAVLAGLLYDELTGTRPLALRAPALGSAFTFAGVAAAALMARVPGDARYAGWHLDVDAGLVRSSLAAPLRALAPFPGDLPAVAGTHVLDGATAIAAALALAAVGTIMLVLRDRPAALVVFATGTAGTLILLYGKLAYAGAPRHHGHVFLALVAALWLAPAVGPRAAAVGGRDAEHRRRLLGAVLAVQVLASAWVLGNDAVRPYSASRAAAAAIESAGLADAPIVAAPGVPASGIAAHLDRAIVHVPPGRPRTYVVWDRTLDAPVPAVADLARDLAVAGGGVLVAPAGSPAPPGTETVAVVDDALVADERFTVLYVPPSGGASVSGAP